MVASTGPLATIDSKLRQARKGATVAVDSCAGVWLVGVHHQFIVFRLVLFVLITPFIAYLVVSVVKHCVVF